jgi:arginyl-tRNA synthetase
VRWHLLIMKIDINKIKVVPKSLSNDFKLCIYGTPEKDVQEWIDNNSFEVEVTEKYTNIILPNDVQLSDIFLEVNKFEWMDGFSPNLNKKLHIGHFSNLVIGKAFKSLGICEKTVSIYGDTLDGEVKKEDAIQALTKYQNDFQFFTDKSLMASEVKYNGGLLKDGTGDYDGTKIFEVGEDKVVGIKSTGQTSYFYQDVSLAEMLNAPTLYLTGKEQCNHFDILKKLFPNIQHIGLGLVKVSGLKMASRIGNVILIEDFIEQVKETFNGNLQLIYNVFAGFILKSNPDVDKGINLDIISNPKNSAGLYISYTMARLNSAGCKLKYNEKFSSKELEFAYLKAKSNLKPNILFEQLTEHCKEINSLYINHTIKDNDDNKKMFEVKLSDLIYGCNKLGLFTIDKV